MDKLRAIVADPGIAPQPLEVTGGDFSIAPNGTIHSAQITGREISITRRETGGKFGEREQIATHQERGKVRIQGVFYDTLSQPIVTWSRGHQTCTSGKPVMNLASRCVRYKTASYLLRYNASSKQARPVAFARGCKSVTFLAASPETSHFAAECENGITVISVDSNGERRRKLVSQIVRGDVVELSATMLDQDEYAIVFENSESRKTKTFARRMSIVRGRLSGGGARRVALRSFPTTPQQTSFFMPSPRVWAVQGSPVVTWTERGRLMLAPADSSDSVEHAETIVGRGARNALIDLADSGKGIVAWTRYTGNRRIRMRVKPFSAD